MSAFTGLSETITGEHSLVSVEIGGNDELLHVVKVMTLIIKAEIH